MINKPQIGIFWLLENGRLLVDTAPYTQSEKIVGNYVSYSDHYNFWETNVRPELNQEYTDNPRGRVVYNLKTGKAKIMAGKSILANKKLVAKIVKAFNLKDYILRSDEHYEQANFLL
jgi:hypothetical protein